MSKSYITIHTDGSCTPNPGSGGYAAVLWYNGRKKVVTGTKLQTTCNEMELMAAILGMDTIKLQNQFISIYSDSQYVVCGGNGSWNIKTHLELWKELRGLIRKHKEVTFNWIPRQMNKEADGHAKTAVRLM